MANLVVVVDAHSDVQVASGFIWHFTSKQDSPDAVPNGSVLVISTISTN